MIKNNNYISNIMKKLVYILFCLLALNLGLSNCGSTKGVSYCEQLDSIGTDSLLSEYVTEHTSIYNRDMFNSYCITNQIPNNISKWDFYVGKEYESKIGITKYIYVHNKTSYILEVQVFDDNDSLTNDTAFSVVSRTLSELNKDN